MKRVRRKILYLILLSVICITAVLLYACDKGIQTESFTIVYTVQDGGRIEGISIQRVERGGNGTQVIAIADTGYEFVGWSDGKTDVARIDTDITEDRSIAAIFKKKMYTVEYTAEAGGSIVGVNRQQIKHGENGAKITAVPNAGYEFVGWSDGKTEAERTEINVIKGCTLTAKFRKKVLTVEYISETGGIIEGNCVQKISYGDIGTLVGAIPQNGYLFVGWSDGNTRTWRSEINVTENLTITAKFVKKEYTIEYVASAGGSVEGNVLQRIKYGENGVTVKAVPESTYEFVKWSDGIKTAERTETNVVYDNTLTAIFKKKTFKVRYESSHSSLGLIRDVNRNSNSGFFTFEVEYGMDAPEILAVAKKNQFMEDYEFFYWSDGCTAKERQDKNITSDVTYTAYFGFKADYLINGNVGGRIVGNTSQQVIFGEVGEVVKAVPDKGYVFMGWSDFKWEPERQDEPGVRLSLELCRNIEMIAYFEPEKKTFAYDYGYNEGANFSTAQITLNRSALSEVKFEIPTREGYVFCGWYADKDFLIRIANETGRYLYGYAAFSLETDTLYARWEKEDEKSDNHKVLMIFVDEVQAIMYSHKLQKDVAVNSRLSPLKYEYYKCIVEQLRKLLNEWFEGIQKFEVDAYFTNQVLTEGFVDVGGAYRLFSYEIKEMTDLVYKYHNTITVVNLGDYRDIIELGGGLSTIKDAYVNGQNILRGIGSTRTQEYIEALKNDEIEADQTILDTCLHELAHTAESYYKIDKIFEFHSAMHYAISQFGETNILNTIKPYLLGQFMVDGVPRGIPMEYWKHEMPIPFTCSIKTAGAGPLVVDGDIVDSQDYFRYPSCVIYGGDVSMEIKPKYGYRFVRWSDGVTTAKRYDRNVISFLEIEAIFEKI